MDSSPCGGANGASRARLSNRNRRNRRLRTKLCPEGQEAQALEKPMGLNDERERYHMHGTQPWRHRPQNAAHFLFHSVIPKRKTTVTVIITPPMRLFIVARKRVVFEDALLPAERVKKRVYMSAARMTGAPTRFGTGFASWRTTPFFPVRNGAGRMYTFARRILLVCTGALRGLMEAWRAVAIRALDGLYLAAKPALARMLSGRMAERDGATLRSVRPAAPRRGACRY